MAFNVQERIAAGIVADHTALPPQRSSLSDLPPGSEELSFVRQRNSHRGIHRFVSLKRLWLSGVNQEFLEELAELPEVQTLFVVGLTASDLSPLRKLRHLRRLILVDGSKVPDLGWLEGLPPLEALGLENFKRVGNLGPLAAQPSLLSLACEGSIWSRMRVESLEPLSALHWLRALFLTNLTTSDKTLAPLHSLEQLRVLQIGALFPDEELVRLRQALPALKCSWFEMIDRFGSTKAGIKDMVKHVK